MKNLSYALKEGVKMASKRWWKWIQIPVFLVSLAALIYSPFGLSLIDNLFLKVLAWVLLLVVIMITAICVGLTPYWGQQEIMRKALEEKDIWIATQEKLINEWRNRANELEVRK